MNPLFQDNRDGANPSNPDPDRGRKMAARLAKSHYENFVVASVLLPKRIRQPFFDIYAFCRIADDLADESPTPAIATCRLAEFQEQLDQTFSGHPPTDLFAALGETIAEFDLPKQPFDDLLEAFRQDQVKFRYQDSTELYDYCRRSANPVGRLVLALGQSLDHESCVLSDDICTGLQLANFWQDVSRDFSIGRIYLPLDAMIRHGVAETDLADGIANRFTPAGIREALRCQCDVAEAHLRRGLPLVTRVPRWLSTDVRLFVHGGLATVEAIRKIDYDVLRIRPKVTKTKHAAMLIRAATGWLSAP